jgi:hypothetical protein
MVESEWVEINQPLRAIQPVRVSSHRVRSQSPFNLPRAIRTIVSPEEDTTKIEFRYIEDEPTRPKELSNNVTVWIGKTSKRIRGIQYRRRPSTQSSRQSVNNAIDKLISDLLPTESQARGNYQVIKEVASAQLANTEH